MDQYETDSQRQRVVEEARGWIGTPYHHRGRVKGGGVDCGMILAEVYEAAGVVPHVDPGEYPHDWHLHRDEQRYLAQVEAYAHKIEGPPQPGDIALFQYGRCISHGAIVVEWPEVIHAYVNVRGVVLDNAVQNKDLESRLVGFWSPWGEA